jgi:hypothetical protein
MLISYFIIDSFNQYTGEFDEFQEIDYTQISNYKKNKVNSNNSFSQNFQLSDPVQSSILPKGKELSNTLIISDLGPDVNLNILEDVFREKCLDLQTSMPDDIKFLESMRSAYIIFPSIPVATKIYESTLGKIYINANYYELVFTPNFASNSNPYIPSQNKSSLTYVTSLNDNSQYTTSMETTVHEDWICEFVNKLIFNYHIFSVKYFLV